MRETDILIVGAGPTGLALACELKRRGVRIGLIEKIDEFPITSPADERPLLHYLEKIFH